MEVNPSFPAKTVPDFIAYAKAHPGEISFASAGNGSVAHVTGELFQNDDRRQHAACALSGSATGADRSHCRTGACHVRQYAFLHRTHQGRQAAPISVTATTRLEALPDVPQLATSYRVSRRARGPVSARRRTHPPKSSTRSTGRSTPSSLNPAIRTRVADLGGEVLALSPSEYTRRIAEETDKWAKVIKFSGAKAE
jgi:tripartite-type tricarboxylate transporter receptor subunit TctC